MSDARDPAKHRFSGDFRAARRGDLPVIMQIENACFGDERYDPRTMNSYLQKSLRGPRTPLVLAFAKAAAKDSEAVAGYGLGDLDAPAQGHIISMAVAEEFRGQGLGRALLDRVCDSLKEAGARRIVLEVETTNKAAISLYTTAGFRGDSVIPNYYGPRRDARRMILDL